MIKKIRTMRVERRSDGTKLVVNGEKEHRVSEDLVDTRQKVHDLIQLVAQTHGLRADPRDDGTYICS